MFIVDNVGCVIPSTSSGIEQILWNLITVITEDLQNVTCNESLDSAENAKENEDEESYSVQWERKPITQYAI